MNFARENERQHWSVVIGDSRYRRKHLVVTCPLETQRSRNKEKTEKWGEEEGVTQRGSCPAPVRGGKGFWKEGRKVGCWRVTFSPGHVAIFLFEKGRPVGGTGGWRYGGYYTPRRLLERHVSRNDHLTVREYSLSRKCGRVPLPPS